MAKIFTKEVIISLIVIAVAVILYLFIKKVVSHALIKKAKDRSDKKALTIISLVTNIIKYVILAIALLTILSVWGVDTKALIASLGVLGVVAGLAVQDLLKDIIAGVDIITEDQFKVGDNVQIGTFRGNVIELGIKTTRVRAYTGEVKIISNRNITEVINYSAMPLKCIIDVTTSYDDDIDKIEIALQNVCKKLNAEIKYLTSPIEILGVENIDTNSVVYRLVADTEFANFYGFRRLVLKEIVQEFKRQHLEIPYPKMEVYDANRV